MPVQHNVRISHADSSMIVVAQPCIYICFTNYTRFTMLSASKFVRQLCVFSVDPPLSHKHKNDSAAHLCVSVARFTHVLPSFFFRFVLSSFDFKHVLDDDVCELSLGTFSGPQSTEIDGNRRISTDIDGYRRMSTDMLGRCSELDEFDV